MNKRKFIFVWGEVFGGVAGSFQHGFLGGGSMVF